MDKAFGWILGSVLALGAILIADAWGAIIVAVICTLLLLREGQ